jgi:hypothetical protein
VNKFKIISKLQNDDDMYSERNRNDEYFNRKGQKPDQNYYQSKQYQQFNSKPESSKRYELRQTSEPRIMPNNNHNSNNNNNNNNFSSNQEQDKGNYGNSDRNRDQYEHRPNKPPLGPAQRINAAALRSLPMNIDSLPPRLKKKYLKDLGLPEELADKPIMDIAQQSTYSNNTLPFGNRNRYDQYYPQNFQNTNYQVKYRNPNYHHSERGSSNHRSRSRSITPPAPQQHRHQHQQPLQQQPLKLMQSKNDWKMTEKDDDTSKNKDRDNSAFDWSEDVLNSHSLPHDVNSTSQRKYDDHNRHRNRRRRNRRYVTFFII